MTNADIEFLIEEFKRGDFAGMLNHYRNADRNSALTLPPPPSRYVAYRETLEV